MRFRIYLDSWWIPGFVWIRSGFRQIPNNIHATYNEIHININVFYVDSWILIRNPEWIPTCSVRDSSRDRPLDPASDLFPRSPLRPTPLEKIRAGCIQSMQPHISWQVLVTHLLKLTRLLGTC